MEEVPNDPKKDEDHLRDMFYNWPLKLIKVVQYLKIKKDMNNESKMPKMS